MLHRILLALVAVVFAAAAQAETYPSQPIHMIVPFPAGGVADLTARAAGNEMEKMFGQPVIIENRPGAGGNIGADAVAKSAPDGYTLLMSSSGILTANPHIYSRMLFDAATAFTAVSKVVQMNALVMVHPKVAARSLPELVALARKEPGKLNFGSAGIGTAPHLGIVKLMEAAQIKITHVPYKGAAPAVTDLVAGQIDGMVADTPLVITHIQDGKLRPLAYAAEERLPLLPDVPTVRETGVPNFVVDSWFGIVAPAGTPPAVVARLHEAIVKVTGNVTLRERFAKMGVSFVGSAPEQFGAQIRAEYKAWGDLIRAANIKVQ
jgi:tripartite-type tricarboxylate transporter receptor subunit TctC